MEMDFLQLFISLLSCIVYVYNSYQDEEPTWSKYTEPVLGGFVIIDWLIYFYTATNRLEYVIQLTSIVDILTVIPLVVNRIYDNMKFNLTFLRIFRILRTVEVLKSPKLQSASDIHIRIATLILRAVCTIFSAAAIFQLFENNERSEEIEFHDCVYFMVITLATVGYGDVSPRTLPGKYFISMMIIMSVVYVPVQASQIYEIFSRISNSLTKYNGAKDGFVLLTGELSLHRIKSFLRELFHQDHGKQYLDVVILYTSEVPHEVKDFLSSRDISSRVTLIRGSCSNYHDLQRAQASHADAIFIFTDLLSSAPEKIDDLTSIRIMSFIQYNPKSKIYAEARLIKNKETMISAGAVVVICLEEIENCIMAQSVMCPGIATLVTNLIFCSSFNEEYAGWAKNYCHGADMEIYETTTTESHMGKTFSQVAKEMFVAKGIILLAVEVLYEGRRCICLNPADKYIFRQPKETIYVVSSDNSDAVRVTDSIFSEISKEIVNIHHQVSLGSSSDIQDDGNSEDFMDDVLPTASMSKVNKDQNLNWKNVEVESTVLQNHILVCGSSSLEGIRAFVGTVRSQYNDIQIVYLNLVHPPEEELKLLQFHNVFFVKGSGKSEADLKMVNVQNARDIVILGNYGSESSPEEFMLDSESIMITLAINKSESKITPFVDIAYPSNLKLLQIMSDIPDLGDLQFNCHPAYAAGSVYAMSEMAHSLIGQSFFNNQILQITLMMLCRTNYILPRPIEDAQSHIRKDVLPQQYHNATFESLYCDLVDRGIVCLGLYRKNRKSEPPSKHHRDINKRNMGSASLMKLASHSEFRYVFTSPPRDTVLLDDDEVFYLCLDPKAKLAL
eukprot:TRINITY_DN5751_c0_g1_i2.p1 TRINITY_DN5751_c0_g1~~TRINITY_DN5751_c0_g1_i2.p1  ORF type:complete len:842 (-),score=118.39 TRINITY_DN5751_c0_g1_i2:386-2911(-)